MSNHENTQPSKEFQIYLPRIRQFIPVSQEVYYEYYRPIWRIQKRAQAHGQCVCTRKNLWKCDGDCLVCPFHSAGDTLSLDAELESDDGATMTLLDTIADPSINIEDTVADSVMLEELLKALDELNPEGRRMCELIMQGQSEREAATTMQMARSTFKRHWATIKAKLYDRLKDSYL